MFASFYHGLATEAKRDSNFELSNLVNLKPSLSFNLRNDLQDFVQDAKGIFDKIKKNMTTIKKDHV